MFKYEVKVVLTTSEEIGQAEASRLVDRLLQSAVEEVKLAPDDFDDDDRDFINGDENFKAEVA